MEYSLGMSVPLTLLGLLERGPSHGYDLKRDYDAYFGRGRPLRYSQVYATLSRLARDGKAVAGPVEQESRARTPAVRHHRGGHRRRGAVAGRAGPAGAGPAERAVRQGGARPDARPAGRRLPGCPAGGAPAADARAHRAQAATAICSACCSPTTRSTDWRLTCDGSTTPRPGWTCSRGRCAGDRGPPRRCGGPRTANDHRGAGPGRCRSARRRRCAAPRSTVRQGEIVAVMGPSGSGKSTLLHCLAGILVPDQGEVWFGGQRLDTLSDDRRSALRRDRFGFVFQSGQLVPELTAEENVALPLLLSGTRRGPAMTAARKWFGTLGLDGLEAPQVRGAVRRAGPARRAGPRPGRRARGAVRRRADRVAGLGVGGTGDGACSPPPPASRAPPSSWSPTTPGSPPTPTARSSSGTARSARSPGPSRDPPRTAAGDQRRPRGRHPAGRPGRRGRPRRRPAADRRGRDQRGHHLEQQPRMVLDRHRVRARGPGGGHRPAVVAPQR